MDTATTTSLCEACGFQDSVAVVGLLDDGDGNIENHPLTGARACGQCVENIFAPSGFNVDMDAAVAP